MTNTPAGWYPQADGRQRYWDGTQWTEHFAPGGAGQSAAGGVASAASTDRPWFKKKRFIIPGALVGLMILGSAMGGADTPSTSVALASSSPSPSSTTAPIAAKATPTASAKATPAPSATPEPSPTKAAPKVTTAQANALRSAENYLEFKGFSKKGLIQQLSSEYGDGFAKADATWAVEHLDVNWNEQAVRAAESYLELKGFSRQGLIEQLSSEYGDQFTVKQATYAAKAVGL